MIIIDASASFVVLIEAVSSLKCWFVEQEIVAWTKDSNDGLGDEQVSHCVQGCTVEEAIKSLKREHGGLYSTFITCCRKHGDAARAMGIHPLIATEHDTPADVAARIVSDIVRMRKVESSELCVVACAMKHSRQVSLCKQNLVHLLPHQGVMYCPVDPVVTDISIAFDALLVKATDYLDEKLDAQGNLSVDFHTPLQQLVNKAEADGKPVIDNLDCIRIVLDRRETRRRLQHMEQATDGLVRWSPAVLVPARGSEAADAIRDMQQALTQCHALICKPCVACGVPQSHDMRLVWDAHSLPPSMEVFPYLAEAFHNHGGTVIKCYAVGRQVFLKAAPSIPDCHLGRFIKNMNHESQDDGQERGKNCSFAHLLQSARGEIAFHSLNNLPSVPADAIDGSLAHNVATVMAAERCAEVIRDATGLSIFGFDLTIPSAGGGVLLVDVNAFPSFKSVDGAAESLRLFLRSICQKRVRGSMYSNSYASPTICHMCIVCAM